jgi:hypothetical protein
VREVAISGHLDADDGDILTPWALAGEGVVLKPAFEAAEHLRAGTLRLVLPDHPPLPATLAVLHAYQRMTPPKVQAFGDALIEEARAPKAPSANANRRNAGSATARSGAPDRRGASARSSAAMGSTAAGTRATAACGAGSGSA